jgi:hypothetical protein
MTDIAKKIKNASQDAEAKMKRSKEHAEGKPSSENLNIGKGFSYLTLSPLLSLDNIAS